MDTVEKNASQVKSSQPKSFVDDQSKNPPPKSLLDAVLRRFARATYVGACLALYGLASVAIAFSLVPAFLIFDGVVAAAGDPAGIAGLLLKGFLCGVGFFAAGLGLMLAVVVLNYLLPTRFEEFKGGYYTLAALPWFLHNGLFYMVRFTFLPFATLTPFGVWFLKGMGMKVGKHAFINSEYLSDPRFIEIGDDAAIGGSARIFAHYGGGGNLVLARVKIGNRATIGAGACIMGDVHIGDGALVMPHSVVLPGSRIPAGETWGGVPAQPIPKEEMAKIKAKIRP